MAILSLKRKYINVLSKVKQKRGKKHYKRLNVPLERNCLSAGTSFFLETVKSLREYESYTKVPSLEIPLLNFEKETPSGHPSIKGAKIFTAFFVPQNATSRVCLPSIFPAKAKIRTSSLWDLIKTAVASTIEFTLYRFSNSWQEHGTLLVPVKSVVPSVVGKGKHL